VLLDLYLPGSNGIEVAQRIRESGHAFLPIVFLSGEHDLDLRFDAIRMGADDFITKPVKPRHLVTAVESRIKRARQLAAMQQGGRGEAAWHFVRPRRDGQRSAACRTSGAGTLPGAGDDRGRRSRGMCCAVSDLSPAGTLSQQLAAAIAAEIRGARTLSAWGELKFLALLHADDELVLREQLETLRGKLDARPWLSEGAPARMHVSMGCLRLHAQVQSVEEALERVRALCATRAAVRWFSL